jgi:excisionase family DNA binding protein
MEPLAVDIKEAARLTSLSTRTIRRYIKSGGIRPVVRIGRRLLIPLASLRALIGQDPSVGTLSSMGSGIDIAGDGAANTKT